MSHRRMLGIDCDEWFKDDIRKESVEVRSAWLDLLALAAKSGPDFTIKLPGTEVGYSDSQLAAILNLEVEVWTQVKVKLSDRFYVFDFNKIEIKKEHLRSIKILESKSNTSTDRLKKRVNSQVNFSPPTIVEVAEYCKARCNGIDPEAFHAWYTTRGWKLNNGLPMVNWKSAVVTWEKRR